MGIRILHTRGLRTLAIVMPPLRGFLDPGVRDDIDRNRGFCEYAVISSINSINSINSLYTAALAVALGG
jgi:hypothetical protein